MIRHLFCGVVTVLLTLSAYAQDNSDVIIDEHNKDSSSFVADPDPLDPLPAKRENIKDGDEIILDDIRDVLDRKIPAGPSANGGADSSGGAATSGTQKKSIKKSSSSSAKKSRASRLRSPDDPDLNIEDRLHRQYQLYDQTPTSPQQWSQATQNQKENIYIVQKSDNLYTISRTLFGDSKFWPKIWALNRDSIYNPHQIYPGMKIYFYSGDSQSAPTLSFTSQSGATASSTGGAADAKLVQNTEFVSKVLEAKPDKNRSYPVPIPDSLPETYNSALNSDKKSVTQLDIRDLQYNEPENFKNPYTLSSVELKSDFTIPVDQVQNLLCRDNQFVPMVVKNKSDVPAGRFLIVEQLERNKDRLKNTYIYRTIGSVVINDKNQMRVSDCKQLMDVNTLIISADQLAAARPPTETFKSTAHIVEGFEYAQDMFAGNQLLIINVDGVTAEDGNRLSVYSDVMGKTVGQVKILRRSGTMAIAVVTQASDQISQGDRVIEENINME